MTEALKVPASSDAAPEAYSTALTFESLGVAEPLCKALADQGITTAFPIQALTIADALAGRDVCGKAKTGSGKTLAFGLPLLQRLAEGLAGADGAVVPLAGPPGASEGARPPAHPRARRPGLRRAGAARARHGAAHRRRLRRRGHRAPGPPASQGLRGHHRDPRTADRPRRPRRARGRGPRRARPRRGRPHGRHGVHAPGRVGAAPGRRARPTRRSCSPRPSTARWTGSCRRYLTDPVFHEVQSATQTVDRDGPPVLPGAPDGQGQGRRGHLPGERQGPAVRAHEARRGPPRPAARPRSASSPVRSTATCGSPSASARSRTSRPASSTSSSRPTSRPGGSTSTRSTSWSTTTRPRTTRRTCTARAARPAPGPPASSSRCCCGTRSSRPRSR